MGAQTPKCAAAETMDTIIFFFFENCVVDFMVSCVNENRKLCRNLFCKKSVKIHYSTILNNRRDDMLCGYMFTVENSQSDEFYHGCINVNVKS